MTTYLLYFSVFAAAVLIAGLLGASLRSGAARSKAINRRMQAIEADQDRFRALTHIRLERGLQEDGTLAAGMAPLRKLYTQSGVVAGPKKLFLVALVGAAIAGFVLKTFTGAAWVGWLGGLVVLVGGPWFYLGYKRDQRLAQFSRQLPDAIDVIVRSLYAGHPLSASLALVASEMPDPIGSEFGMLNDELTYGTDMDVALQNLMARTPVDDLAMFTMAVLIQRQTGGNLAEILETLSSTIRDRFLLKQKVRALTSEGRYSAVFMTLFPFLVYALLRVLAPGYFDPVWESGYGTMLTAGCLTTMALGNIVLRKMVNFRV